MKSIVGVMHDQTDCCHKGLSKSPKLYESDSRYGRSTHHSKSDKLALATLHNDLTADDTLDVRQTTFMRRATKQLC